MSLTSVVGRRRSCGAPIAQSDQDSLIRPVRLAAFAALLLGAARLAAFIDPVAPVSTPMMHPVVQVGQANSVHTTSESAHDSFSGEPAASTEQAPWRPPSPTAPILPPVLTCITGEVVYGTPSDSVSCLDDLPVAPPEPEVITDLLP